MQIQEIWVSDRQDCCYATVDAEFSDSLIVDRPARNFHRTTKRNYEILDKDNILCQA